MNLRNVIVAMLSLLLTISNKLSFADELATDNFGISFSLRGGDSALEFRKAFDPMLYLVASFSGRSNSYRSESARQEYSFTTSSYETFHFINENKRAQVNTAIGFRNYFTKSTYAIFFQTTFGPFFTHSQNNYFSDNPSYRSSNYQSDYDIGFSLDGNLGVEYRFSERMSLAGVYYVTFSKVDWSVGGTSKTYSTSYYSGNALSVNYYW